MYLREFFLVSAFRIPAPGFVSENSYPVLRPGALLQQYHLGYHRTSQERANSALIELPRLLKAVCRPTSQPTVRFSALLFQTLRQRWPPTLSCLYCSWQTLSSKSNTAKHIGYLAVLVGRHGTRNTNDLQRKARLKWLRPHDPTSCLSFST